MATKTANRQTSNGTRNSRTADRNKKAADRNVDATADRIRDLNERILESSKKAGNTYLDVYEKTLNSIADYTERVGENSQVDWVKTVTDAQADFTRQLASAYTSAARSLLK
ncbi:MAG: hypothetical protein QOG63_737 [Thermoleophilaceae bacterium]|jgi:hypothetical protein|nr:hypothetical protein [Thermoleophilaceae bacterium]